MSDNQLEVTFHNDPEALNSCCLAVRCFLEARDAAPGFADSATALLEDFVGNTIRYGYDDDEVHEIVVTLTLDPGRVEVQIEDDGRELPPTDGDVQYHRVGDRNVTVVEIEAPDL